MGPVRFILSKTFLNRYLIRFPSKSPVVFIFRISRYSLEHSVIPYSLITLVIASHPFGESLNESNVRFLSVVDPRGHKSALQYNTIYSKCVKCYFIIVIFNFTYTATLENRKYNRLFSYFHVILSPFMNYNATGHSVAAAYLTESPAAPHTAWFRWWWPKNHHHSECGQTKLVLLDNRPLDALFSHRRRSSDAPISFVR